MTPAAAPAQHYVPRTLATVEGGSSTAVPFGLSQPVRVMCLYDREELPWTAPVVINSLHLRADNDVPGTTTFARKQYIVMDVRLATAARRSDAASTRFDDNLGLDAAFVLLDSRLVLPAQPPLLAAPRACDVQIPMSQPFFFDLSPVRGPRPPAPGLAVDFRVYLQPVGDYRMDSPFVCTSTLTSFGNLGPACQTSRGLPLSITSNNSVRAGDRITYTVDNMPRDALFLVSLGATPATGSFYGIPLPVPLAPLGAPDCWINTEWLLLAPALADQTGRGQVTYPIAPGRHLVGRSIHAQAMCQDVAANRFLHVTSLGVATSICGPLGITRISQLGDAQAPVGAVSYGSGFVMLVQ
jgi:hypothetical protein